MTNNNNNGYFGQFGGSFIPENLQYEMDKISTAYEKLKNDPTFITEVNYIRKHYQGRPTPLTHVKNLSTKIGGAQIFLKREDLNHTGAHKLNHCIAEVLLAKHLGKKKVIAETGAGQHGVAMAAAAAYLGLECEIHMGEVDTLKQHPNVQRMQLMGTKVITVMHGQRTLKEAVDSAFEAYLADTKNSLYCIGSVVGPHPFPTMVHDFQSVVGFETRLQMFEHTGKLPDHVIACVGGGSNAIGLFSGFINDPSVKLYGVEPMGRSDKIGEHAATIQYGVEDILHGFKTIVLKNTDGTLADAYSIASGLDYQGVGPEHAHLADIGRATYVGITDTECLDAFYELSRTEGIIPALESAHAVAYGMKLAATLPISENIIINLSGRGDKDLDFVVENYGIKQIKL